MFPEGSESPKGSRDPPRERGAGHSSASSGGTVPKPVGQPLVLYSFVALYVDPPGYCEDVEDSRRASSSALVDCGAINPVVIGCPGSEGAQRPAGEPAVIGGVIGPGRDDTVTVGMGPSPGCPAEGSLVSVGGVTPLRGGAVEAGSGPLAGLVVPGTGLKTTARLKSRPTDVSHPQPPPLTQDVGTSVLRIATINDGRLSDSRSIFLSGWMQDMNVDVCLVSEAAHSGKRELLTEEVHQWAQPLMQGKGGAGFLYRRELLKGKIVLTQDADLHWGIALWRFPCGMLLVSVYINPDGSKDACVQASLLGALEESIAAHPRCVIGGDFNAPSGAACRRRLNAWCEQQGLSLVNPGLTTHMLRETSVGTDLDLLFVRGVTARYIGNDGRARQSGHIRQIFEVRLESPLQRFSTPVSKIAWRRLEDPELAQKFRQAVEEALPDSTSVDQALLKCAPAVLGYAAPAGRIQLPARVRQKIQRLRRSAKSMAQGSAEHYTVICEVGAILRAYRVKAWQKKMRRMAMDVGVTEEGWQLVRQLRKSNATARSVGVPDDVVCAAYEEVYGSNCTRRPDWVDGQVLPTSNLRISATQPNLDSATLHRLDSRFSPADVTLALRSLPKNKAPGLDGIPHEAYKALLGGDVAMRAISRETSRVLEGRRSLFTDGRLVVIPKKGPTADPLKMRPLMMLPTSRKLLEQMVAQRLDLLAAASGWDGLHHLQGGFRRGMSLERQLLLTEIVFSDALASGRRLRVVALDLVKAFDRIPRQFAAHCAASYLRQFCPRLANLVVSLATSPLRAHVGESSFEVVTGVPQGGILSPRLFVMAMNDLLLRIGNQGYTLSDGRVIGSLLYADDILLLDEDLESSEERCRLTKGWLQEWGGQINSGKTQWLDTSSHQSPPPLEPSSSLTSGVIDYLGMHITSKGIRPKVEPEELFACAGSLTAISRADGLPPATVLATIRAVGWPKVALGLTVALPELCVYVRRWQAVGRQVLCTYRRAHGVEVQRELGLLYHPVYWMCRALVQFYGNAHDVKRDPYLAKVVREVLIEGHPIRTRVEAMLQPAGITWAELASVSVADLQRKATGRVREWTRTQLRVEAQRLGVYSESVVAWQDIGDSPASYLDLENGRYGFPFRLRHLGPPDMEIEDCYFCGHSLGNTGEHMLTCARVASAVPLSTELQALPPAELCAALRLHSLSPREHLRLALAHLKLIWDANVSRWKRSRPQHVRYVVTRHNARFMHPSCPSASSGPARYEVPLSGPRVPRGPRLPRQKRATSTVATAAAAPSRALKRRRGDVANAGSKRSLPEEPTFDLESTALAKRLRARGLVQEASSSSSSLPVVTTAQPIAQADAVLAALDPLDHDLVPIIVAEAERCPTDNASSEPDVEEIIATIESPRHTAPEAPYVPSPCPADETPFSFDLEEPSPVRYSILDKFDVPKSGPWSEAETVALAEAVLDLGVANSDRVAARVGTRTKAQCQSRTRTNAFKAVLDRVKASRTLSPPGTPPTPPPMAITSAAPESDIPEICGDSFRSGKWLAEEDARLVAAVREVGESALAELGNRVATRTALQCSDRLRTKTMRELLAAEGVVVPEGAQAHRYPDGLNKGRWTQEELARLEVALSAAVGDPRPAAIAQSVGTRTAAQVADKLQRLVQDRRVRRH